MNFVGRSRAAHSFLKTCLDRFYSALQHAAETRRTVSNVPGVSEGPTDFG
jgi:hypothetical protein